MDRSINKIICRYLNDKQIEKNYQKILSKYFPHGGYDMNMMDRGVKWH